MLLLVLALARLGRAGNRRYLLLPRLSPNKPPMIPVTTGLQIRDHDETKRRSNNARPTPAAAQMTV